MLALVGLAAAAPLVRGATYAVEAGVGSLAQRGHLQTAAGGEPGTTSAERPTLAETGLTGGDYRWLAGTVTFARYKVAMRYTVIGDSGSATLRESLTSQGQTFPAGSAIRSRLDLDGLSLAATRVFASDGGTTLAIGPWIGWTAFALEIDGERHRVDRSYRVYALGVQGRLEKALGSRWHVGAEAVVAPAFPGSAGRFGVAPWLGYRVGDHLEVRLAARLAAFRYDDAHKQDMPNRLHVDRRVLPAISVVWRP